MIRIFVFAALVFTAWPAPNVRAAEMTFYRNRHEALTSPSRDSPAIQPGMS